MDLKAELDENENVFILATPIPSSLWRPLRIRVLIIDRSLALTSR